MPVFGMMVFVQRAPFPEALPEVTRGLRRGDQPSPASGRKPAIPLSGLALARPANPMATATYRCRRQVATPDTGTSVGARLTRAVARHCRIVLRR